MIQYATIHHDHANLKGTHTQRHPLYCLQGLLNLIFVQGFLRGCHDFSHGEIIVSRSISMVKR